MSLKMGQRTIPKDQHHFPRFQKMAILGYWPSLGQAQCSLTKPAKLVCPTSFFSKKESPVGHSVQKMLQPCHQIGVSDVPRNAHPALDGLFF